MITEFPAQHYHFGIELNALVGQHFRLGEAELAGVELCAPVPIWPASFVYSTSDLALGAGLHATVIGSGRSGA